MTEETTTARRAAGVVVSASQTDDARTVEISFSSEEPYMRDGRNGPFWEVLGHTPDEVDLSRLATGAAPLLADHAPYTDHQPGVVERAWLDAGKGRAVVRFATTATASDLLAKVRDGIVTCVSVGYRIITSKPTGETRDGVPVVRVTRWQPYEVSFVSIPADPTVGLGRSATEAPTPQTTQNPDSNTRNSAMPDTQQNTPAAGNTGANTGANTGDQTIDLDAIRAAAVQEAMTRSAEIDGLARKFNLPSDMVEAAKREAVSLDDFRQRALDHIDTTQEAAATNAGATLIGMRSEEVQTYSLFNAVRYLMNPQSRKAEQAAGFEIECSRAYADRTGKEAGGLFIPDEVLADSSFLRSQNTQSAAAGGALVPSNYMAGSFIEVLRSRMVLTSLGARVMSGLKGAIDIPKRLAGASFYWVDEDEDSTDSASNFGLVSMSAHTCAGSVPITRKMLLNGSPDVEALVRDDLLSGMAVGIDQAALVGGGGVNAPSSVRDLIFSGATDWAGSATMPTFAEMVALETGVAMNNADLGRLGYVYNPATSGHLKTTPRFAGGEVPIEMGNEVNGYGRARTTSMGSGEVIFGNWADLLIGYWSGFDLRVDNATKAASDGKILRVFTDMDVAVRHEESFQMGKPDTVIS